MKEVLRFYCVINGCGERLGYVLNFSIEKCLIIFVVICIELLVVIKMKERFKNRYCVLSFFLI